MIIFFSVLLALTALSDNDRIILSKENVEIHIDNREGDEDQIFKRIAYYLRDRTFVMSETNYYRTSNGVHHEFNAEIEISSWLESIKP